MFYRLTLALIACIITAAGVLGQIPVEPPGASKFIRSGGGLMSAPGKGDLIEQLSDGNFDAIEAGGGGPDWTKINGRVFLTRHWMVEIGKIRNGYSTFDFEQRLARSLREQLQSEGFKLTPTGSSRLGPLRYQRGKTVGTLDVFSFWLGGGNPPLHLEFIFHESYLERSSLRIKAR